MTSFSRACHYAIAALLLGAVLVSGGCARRDGADVDAVRGYVDGLPAALHADTLDGIAPHATDDEIDRVRLYVAKVLHDGFRMEATVDGFSALSAESDGNASTVKTREEWTIRFINAETGVVDHTEAYRLEASYHLIMADGTWLVSGVEETDRVTR